jgi:hypothetical protein
MFRAMKRLFLISFFALSGFTAFGQSTNLETEAVKKVINQLFEGMRKGDSTMVSGTFSKGMILQTISEREGKVQVKTDKPSGFLKAVGTPHPEIWDERITFDQVLIDDNLASVWTSYQFYVGDKFSHCGVNSFQLVKGNEGWKIVYLIDTRRKENCN